jgi:tetratricopeptide (TPR) repeat protein
MRNLIILTLLLASVPVIAQSKKQRKQYDQHITSADSAFNLKNYTFAKEKYKKASSVLSKEQYPKDRMTECDKRIISQTAEYKKFIHLADSCFEKENWTSAKTYYLQSVNVKPHDQYANDQSKNCNFKIVAAAALEARYQETIKKADSCYRIKSWSCAKANYDAALKMKPEQAYPAKKSEECANMMVPGTTQVRYNLLIEQADQQFDSGSYAAAKNKYEEALAIKPDSNYAKERIALCNQKIAEQK